MMIRCTGLAQHHGIRHAFFTRQGGVSDGFYASLNCGYGPGDVAERVTQNRMIAMRMLGLAGERLVTCRQIHSAIAIHVEEPRRCGPAPQADAMATSRPGVVLGVLAADCAPLLLCDPEAGVVGAAHAGWRGAVAGVAEATIEAMEGLGAERSRLRVAIGPCIGPNSYEVGLEFPAPILAHDPSAAACFGRAAREDHFLFDLAQYIEHRLTAAGVEHVERIPHDTAAEPDLFFSYRRARLRGESAFGLGLSAIVIDE
jgi:polyphenol oxidase